MHRTPEPLRTLFLVASLAWAGAVQAQGYPVRPIRALTSEAGSGTDVVARVVAQAISPKLGQQVYVENRGGNAAIPAQAVAAAPPDGYTVLFHGNGFWLQGFLQNNVPYDLLRQFAPITLAASSPNVLVVQTAFSARSVKDLVSQARSRPGTLHYASGAAGTQPHLSAELFRHLAGIQVVGVPYKGSATALTALVAGDVQFMFAPAAAAASQIRPGGKLRPLAVTSERPSALLPDLPMVAEAGLPGYGSELLMVAYAPSGTPQTAIRRLNSEMVQALRSTEARDKLLAVGVEAIGSTPEELDARVRSEMARWGRIIKEMGLRAE